FRVSPEAKSGTSSRRLLWSMTSVGFMGVSSDGVAPSLASGGRSRAEAPDARLADVSGYTPGRENRDDAPAARWDRPISRRAPGSRPRRARTPRAGVDPRRPARPGARSGPVAGAASSPGPGPG